MEVSREMGKGKCQEAFMDVFGLSCRKKSDDPMASDSKKFKENSRIFLRFGRKSPGAFEGVSGRF